MRRQLPHDLLAFRRFEVGNHAALAAIAGMIIARPKIRAVGALDERRAPGARVIAGLRAFDLDDVGAEIGEQLPGPGAGENASKFENADAGKRCGQVLYSAVVAPS